MKYCTVRLLIHPSIHSSIYSLHSTHYYKSIDHKVKGKGKFHTRTGHEDSEGGIKV